MNELKRIARDFRKHLMTGVSFMIPFVVAGGLMIAVSITFQNSNIEALQGFAEELMLFGSKGLKLMIPIFAGYVAFSIADRPGIAPAAIAAYMGEEMGAGFIGAIIIGFIAGVFVHYLNKIRFPDNIRSLKAIIFIPFVATLFSCLFMRYIIGGPISQLTLTLSRFLMLLKGHNVIWLAVLMGFMIAIDLGGPINKTAYAFTILAISEKLFFIAGISSVGVCIPSLGVGLAVLMAPKNYNKSEQAAGNASLIMGMVGITEGAIPFAVSNPIRMLPVLIFGTIVGCSIAGVLGVESYVAWGGPIVTPAVKHVGRFFLSIFAGSLTIAILMNLVWRKRIQDDFESARQDGIIEVKLDLDD